jgi:hypothetical protein
MEFSDNAGYRPQTCAKSEEVATFSRNMSGRSDDGYFAIVMTS